MRKIFIISLCLLVLAAVFVLAPGDNYTITQTQTYDIIDDNGITTLNVVGPRYWNGSWMPIETAVINGSFSGYTHAVEKGIYQMYYKEYVSFGDAIKYCRDGWCFTSQPSKITYRNPTGSNDDIFSSPNSTSVGYPIGNVFKWDSIFGNMSLEYSYDKTELKEVLTLYEKPRIPQSYLGNLSLVTLDFDNYIKYPLGVDMYFTNGTKITTNIQTSEAIEFRNSTDLLYTLPAPIAYDSAGNSVQLQYQVVFDGGYKANKARLMWFYVKTPYTWLNSTDRQYPVMIDPDLTVNTATTLCGVQSYDNVIINATATICAYNGTAPSGTLTFNTATLNITSVGMVVGTGKGWRGQTADTTNPGEGIGGGKSGDAGTVYTGGGAGYGGAGGEGAPAGANGGDGGIAYGSSSNVSSMGSGGGSGDGNDGGNGGAYILINTTILDIGGIIDMNGTAAAAGGTVSGGGGSGGGIKIMSSILYGGGRIYTKGGKGGSSSTYAGGGGAGGRIYVTYCTNYSSYYFNYSGETGGTATFSGTTGGIGTINTTYTSELCVPPSITNPQLNATSINTNEQIRLNTTASSLAGISSVWAEILYPNTTLKNYTLGWFYSPAACYVNGTFDTCAECSYAGCGSCPGCSQSSGWTDKIYSNFDGGTTGWELASSWWAAVSNDATNCVNDANDDCIRAVGNTMFLGYTANYSTTIDLSNCVAGSITVSGVFNDSAVDTNEYLYLRTYNGTAWTEATISSGTTANGPFNVTLHDSHIYSGFRVGFSADGPDSGEYYYIDNIRVSCTAQTCTGTLNCSTVTNETGCNSCGVCNWSQQRVENVWYLDFVDNSASGTYNVSKVYANDTSNQISTISPILGWIVLSGPVANNTCTYSGTGNWIMNCADGCNITTNTSLGGNVLWINGTGLTLFNNSYVSGYSAVRVTGVSAANRCTVRCIGTRCFRQ